MLPGSSPTRRKQLAKTLASPLKTFKNMVRNLLPILKATWSKGDNAPIGGLKVLNRGQQKPTVEKRNDSTAPQDSIKKVDKDSV